MAEHERPRKRGEGVKRAPDGFYTAAEAAKRLGLNRNTFRYYVKTEKIKRHVPPLRKEGFYDKKDIDEMATEIALFFHTHDPIQTGTQVRTAEPRDAAGIVDMLHSFGWQSASVEQYQSWWKVNPLIHFVVLDNGVVVGDLACITYTDEALEGRMSARKRAWDIAPDDILPFAIGKQDTYVGIEVRQNHPDSRRYAARLIAGFLSFLKDLAAQGIIIRRMYGVSAEPPGQKLARDIGFVEQPHEPGDLYENWIRFMLDLETSDSHFAQKYREAIEKQEEDNASPHE